MTVKSDRGRRRYIAFKTGEAIEKDELVSRLKSRTVRPYVIQCSDGWAIVRTEPSECESAMSAVADACPGSEPLSTSGTLRTLRGKYPELQRLRPPKTHNR